MVPTLEAACEALHAERFDVVLNTVSVGHEYGMGLPSLLLDLASQGVLTQLPHLLWCSDMPPGLLDSHARLAREAGVPVQVIPSWSADTPRQVLRVLARGDSLRCPQTANGAPSLDDQELLAALLDERDMRIVVQPQVDLRTGQYIGAEALARWRHPLLGEIPASVFVPMAEKAGLSMLLFHFVEAKVVSLLRRLDQLGVALPVSVNASAVILCAPGLAQRLALRLEQAGLPNALLKVELTEDVPVSDMLPLSTALGALRLRGFSVAVDDYGRGASTLDLLTRLPFSELKIDGRFVRGMGLEPGCNAAVTGAISIAREMGLAFIAEGIETQEQVRKLLELGCCSGQGYALSRPLEVEDFIAKVSAP
ncbi:EAL domain-containing protein [Pseudomonas mosselii]|uniref:EAL domain-containing protein n=1 Tax=Pseudomonas mosselii TaxID=78327 RepID=UPI002DB96CA1|nr:EAL domain-containing protein [Pseudomonas mosselii]MEB5932397.1 EAL domain-containing protein [Pseudomonas mosselii]